MSDNSKEFTYTVQREFKGSGGSVQLLHVPTNGYVYICLADFPGAPEGDTRYAMTNNFAVANKEFSHFVRTIKDWRTVGKSLDL